LIVAQAQRKDTIVTHHDKMVLAKSKNAVGLGNALMNDRFGKGKGTDMRRGNAIHRTGATGERYITNEKKDASWVKMRSVTEQPALDEFLSTAELAGTDFTAERMNNVKILHTDQKNPYLLSAMEERATLKKHKANRNRLTVPRRPAWNETTTPRELDEKERASLLEWRRGLAELQESNDLLLTPFERNIEVWRQLWRVIERSDLVVQIVDARNPLLFRCEDLERYVKEVDPEKENLLLVNKADMMTLAQRETWADYFEEVGVNYKFFSAEIAKEMNEARDALEDNSEEDDESHHGSEAAGNEYANSETSAEVEPESDKTRILTTDELEALFLANAPEVEADGDEQEPRKIQVGLVGYPNVGKSSTINALIGAKKVSVSATPGKTKHFQTIHLSEKVILCDCPGLVFPNFASTKAELVVNGILPIDQLREFLGPAGLVAQRIPQRFLEAMYGMKIQVRPFEEGGTGTPIASEILRAYASGRGFYTTGLGQPDESRAARYVLKDYVKGKLLFCHPPPVDPVIDPIEFNHGMYDESHLPEKRRAAFSDDTSAIPGVDTLSLDSPMTDLGQGNKSKRLDKKFFGRGSTNAGRLTMPFAYQYTQQGQANSALHKQVTGRKERELMALEKNVSPQELRMGSKKHYKPQRTKTRATAAAAANDDYD
jgi:large subunit GTPase 1